MKILIVTDAWSPQVNGVVRTLKATADALKLRGHEVAVISPEGRWTIPMPFYPEIRLALVKARQIGVEIDRFAPDAIQIATEGPLGWAARQHCLRSGLCFTTGFHTRFPDYIAERVTLPFISSIAWAILRRFHAPSRGVMAPTASIAADITRRGFGNARVWTRGVDHTVFRPMPRDALAYPRPILLYAGRLAPEKNIEAFLDLDIPGTKVVVGDGPQRAELMRLFPQAVFTGYRFNDDLVQAYAAADVFVFPSRTDTFGLVMLEAMACGTPIAAFNVPSPIDVVRDGITGALDADLAKAVQRALTVDRNGVLEASKLFTWERAADLFESHLVSTRVSGA